MAADVCPGFEHTRKGMQCELEFVQHALVKADEFWIAFVLCGCSRPEEKWSILMVGI